MPAASGFEIGFLHGREPLASPLEADSAFRLSSFRSCWVFLLQRAQQTNRMPRMQQPNDAQTHLPQLRHHEKEM